jgi:transcription initiation factor TFIIIB Brf1 subunit/transcription initiation factor TFIIB
MTDNTLINLENLEDIFNSNNLDFLDTTTFYQEIYGKLKDIPPEEPTITSQKCPTCFSDDFIEDFSQGFVVCSCGQVICNLLDYRSETKIDDDGKIDNVRCNKVTNPLLPTSSLGTRLPYNVKGNLQKLQNWSAMPYRERSLLKDFRKIDDCCIKFGFKKNVNDDAKIIYSKAKNSRYKEGPNTGKFIITRGKNNKGIMTGSVCISCKKNKIPYNPKEIGEFFGLSIKEFNNGTKTTSTLLKDSNLDINYSAINSELYIKKYCEKNNIRDEFTNEAIKIAKNINRLNIATEHNQFSIAATSVLIMAENNDITNMTKKKLRLMFGVSEVTISKTYKKIEKIKNILTDDQEIDKLIIKIKNKQDSCEKEEINPALLERMKKFGIKVDNSEIKEVKVNNEEVKDFKVKITTTQTNNVINDNSEVKDINKIKIKVKNTATNKNKTINNNN